MYTTVALFSRMMHGCFQVKFWISSVCQATDTMHEYITGWLLEKVNEQTAM